MARLEGRHDVARAELLRAIELTGSASMERHLYARVASGLGYLAGAAGDLAAACLAFLALALCFNAATLALSVRMLDDLKWARYKAIGADVTLRRLQGDYICRS